MTSREKTEKNDARDEAIKQAQATGVYLGSDFTGGGGVPMRLTREGNIVPVKKYLDAARARRRARMRGVWL
jgi:hypothetical protein